MGNDMKEGKPFRLAFFSLSTPAGNRPYTDCQYFIGIFDTFWKRYQIPCETIVYIVVGDVPPYFLILSSQSLVR